MKKSNQQGNTTAMIIISIAVVLIIGMVGFIFLSQSQSQTAQTNTRAMKVTDYSQGAPANQKTTLIIKHDDSTFEKIIISSDNKNTFIKSLPSGDSIAGITPAAQ